MCPNSTTPRDMIKAGTRNKTNKKKKQKEQKVKNVIKYKRGNPCNWQPLDGQARHPATDTGEGAAQKRRQGRRSTSSSPGASQEEVRATQSSNPQPRTDPMSECHHIHAECREGKKTKTPNWSSKWRTPKPRRQTSCGEKRQRWRHHECH